MAEAIQPIKINLETTKLDVETPAPTKQDVKVNEASKPAWEHLSTAASYAQKTLNGARIVANAAYTTAKWTLIAAAVYGIYQSVGIPTVSDAKEAFNGFVFMTKNAVELGKSAGDATTLASQTLGGVGQAVNYAREAVNTVARTEYPLASTTSDQMALGLSAVVALNVVGLAAKVGSVFVSGISYLLPKGAGEAIWKTSQVTLLLGTLTEVIAPGTLQPTTAAISQGVSVGLTYVRSAVSSAAARLSKWTEEMSHGRWAS